MNDARTDIPDETRGVWDALDGLAPEPLSPSASKRIERALEPALLALATRGGLIMNARKALAAAVVIALAGGAAGFGIGATRAEAPAVDHGRQYLLLVHDNEAVERAVQEQGMEAIVERYATWARALADDGRLVSAEHLTPTPEWIGAATPASSSISGYFLIRADSREEALDIARRSPHAELGGVVEVRGIEGAGG